MPWLLRANTIRQKNGPYPSKKKRKLLRRYRRWDWKTTKLLTNKKELRDHTEQCLCRCIIWILHTRSHWHFRILPSCMTAALRQEPVAERVDTVEFWICRVVDVVLSTSCCRRCVSLTLRCLLHQWVFLKCVNYLGEFIALSRPI